MQLIKVISLAALFAGTAIAAPAAEAEARPPKPPKPAPVVVTQTNVCGNNVTPYCCNTDNKGKYTSCSASNGGSICSATIVCCNAQDSVQVCIGSINANTDVDIDIDVDARPKKNP